jgi:hypothetical protein
MFCNGVRSSETNLENSSASVSSEHNGGDSFLGVIWAILKSIAAVHLMRGTRTVSWMETVSVLCWAFRFIESTGVTGHKKVVMVAALAERCSFSLVATTELEYLLLSEHAEREYRQIL